MEKSKLTQYSFHISDGVNYIMFALSIIGAITSLNMDILNGFEGVVYSTNDKIILFVASVILSAIFIWITKHNPLPVILLILIYIGVAVAAKSLLVWVLVYLVITSLPYILSFYEVFKQKST